MSQSAEVRRLDHPPARDFTVLVRPGGPVRQRGEPIILDLRSPIGWKYADGGRKAAGFTGSTGDCVTRAIAIATELPYLQVYDAINHRIKAARKGSRGARGSARTGVSRQVYERYLTQELGWRWTPTMAIGSGTTVHLRASELPPGRIIARCSKHLCAVIDGVIYDTDDPSRDGSRCVYGVYQAPEGSR